MLRFINAELFIASFCFIVSGPLLHQRLRVRPEASARHPQFWGEFHKGTVALRHVYNLKKQILHTFKFLSIEAELREKMCITATCWPAATVRTCVSIPVCCYLQQAHLLHDRQALAAQFIPSCLLLSVFFFSSSSSSTFFFFINSRLAQPPQRGELQYKGGLCGLSLLLATHQA